MNTLSGKRILVTGASGFIGSHLVERLVAEGGNVAGISRNDEAPPAIAGLPFRFIQCDICDPIRAIDAIVSFRPHILFHLAAHPDSEESFSQFRQAVALNLLGSINVLEGFRISEGDLFIYGDSTKVYGTAPPPFHSGTSTHPTSSYAIAKLSGWQFCKLYQRLYGISSVSVRPTMIFGPRQNRNLISFVIEAVMRGVPEIRLDGGSQTRAPLYIADAVDAFVEIAKRGEVLDGRVINIGGAVEFAVSDIARLIVSAMGKNTPVVSVQAQMRPTDVERSWCRNDEAWQMLAWMPKTDLAIGLLETIRFALGSASGAETQLAMAMSQVHR